MSATVTRPSANPPAAPAGAQDSAFNPLAGHRFPELDGIRGVASLSVGIAHALYSFAIPATLTTLLAVHAVTVAVINGGIAVDLFFLMSGFFLTLMIGQPKLAGFPKFYVRRLTRLYPPAAAAVILFALCSALLISPAHQITDFIEDANKLSHTEILLNLLLIRHTLNPVLWTIRLEIFISLLFPFVLLLKTVNNSHIFRVALLGALIAIAIALRHYLKLGLDIFHYLYMFYLGCLIIDYGPAAATLPRPIQIAITTIAITGLAATGLLNPLGGASHPIGYDLETSLFGTLLIAMAAYGQAPALRNLLKASPIQFLGRISYSFYLIHFLAVHAALVFLQSIEVPQRFGLWLSFAAILSLSIPTAIGASTLFCIAIEQPSIALSRRFSKKAAA